MLPPNKDKRSSASPSPAGRGTAYLAGLCAPIAVTVWERNFSKGFGRFQVAARRVSAPGSNTHGAGKEPACVPSPKSLCTAPCGQENEPNGAASAPITSPWGWWPAQGFLVQQHEMAAADRSRAQPDPIQRSPQLRASLIPSEPIKVLKTAGRAPAEPAESPRESRRASGALAKRSG